MIKAANGKKIDIEGIKDGISYTKLVYLIESWAAKNKMLVLEILVNGFPIDKNDEKALSKKKYSENEEVIVKTQDPKKTALNAIREAKKQIPAFEKHIDEIIIAQQKGEKEESIAKFSHLLKSLSDLIQLFKVLEQFMPDEFEAIRIKGKPIIEVNKELLEVLQETKLAMEDRDFVTINDILEYEIKPKISEDFYSILSELEKLFSQ